MNGEWRNEWLFYFSWKAYQGKFCSLSRVPKKAEFHIPPTGASAELSYVTDAIPHLRPLAPEEKKE